MRSLALFCVVTGLLIFLGCLGAGGGGSLGRSPIDPADTNLVSGVAYFADRQLFGGIPILARDANTGAVGGLVRTDSRGAYAFTSLPPSIYNLTATTGNGETTFYSGLQVTGQQAQAVPEASLLGLKDLVIDKVTSSTARVTFHSNLAAISQIALGAATNRFEVSNDLTTTHRRELPGLASGTLYEVTVFMSDIRGQQFVCPGFSFTTGTASGPYEMSITLNNGAFETRSRTVTATLQARNATQCRVAPVETFANATFETFTNGMTKSIELSSGDGTKKVSVQYRDSAGNTSGVLTASILLTTSTNGYLGLWINGGAAKVGTRDVTLTMLYPGATLMQVSNYDTFPSAYWEPFTQYRRWQLLPNDGQRTVYAKFQGADANPLQIFSTTTTLDSTIASSTGTTGGTATGTGTASGTASGTPTPTEPVVDEGPFEIVVYRGPRTDASPNMITEYSSDKPFEMLLEGDSLGLIGEFRNQTATTTVYETSLKWIINDVENGSEQLGKIDPTTNVYTTPSQVPTVGRKLKFTARTNNSYFDPATNGTKVYEASFYVYLKDFWQLRNSGMTNVANTAMPIYSLLIDPIWQPGDKYRLFAGTNGFGVWYAEVDSAADAAPISWNPTALASRDLFNGLDHIVNHLAINVENGDILAATTGGVFILGGGVRDYMGSKEPLGVASMAYSVICDPREPQYVYVARYYGLERFKLNWSTSPPTVDDREEIFLSVPLREEDTRVASGSTVTAYSNRVTFRIGGPPRAMALSYANPNVLYFGNEAGQIMCIENIRDLENPLSSQIDNVFVGDVGTLTNPDIVYKIAADFPDPRPQDQGDGGFGVFTDISIDPNSPWTMLTVSSTGVWRSINRGAGLQLKVDAVNARGVLVDPTNVTYFFYGQENGLYRSKDAGATWKQIKSGLDNHLVVNCFVQSEGPPGATRRIWVGTTGGVFAGAKSLDLY